MIERTLMGLSAGRLKSIWVVNGSFPAIMNRPLAVLEMATMSKTTKTKNVAIQKHARWGASVSLWLCCMNLAVIASYVVTWNVYTALVQLPHKNVT